MSIFNKIILAFKKKFSYVPSTEKVDIRLNSIPDWLYKITVKDSSDLRLKCKDYYCNLKEISNKIKTLADKSKVKELNYKALSKYRVDLIKSNRKLYFEKIDSVFNYDANLETIEEFRLFFKDFETKFSELKLSLKKYEEKIKEQCSDDLEEMNSYFKEVNTLLVAFFNIFVSENDSKSKSIIDSVGKIENGIVKRNKIDSEISKLDSEIKTIRSHIYKINDKLDLLKESSRFKDILEKETKMSEVLDAKDELITSIEKRFVPLEIVLYQYAIKVREEELAKEYVSHFLQAIKNDSEMDILKILNGLDSDLNNSRTKLHKSVGDFRAEELSNQTKWLIANIKGIRDNLLDIEANLKTSRSQMRSYIIFNELEDNESRVEFYQTKLKELVSHRKTKFIEIESLDLLNLKEKLRKDLLIVTGYDVNIIYDD